MKYFTNNADDKMSKSMAGLYASGVVCMAACYNITNHQYIMGAQLVGMKLKVAAGSLIYRKAGCVYCISNFKI